MKRNMLGWSLLFALALQAQAGSSRPRGQAVPADARSAALDRQIPVDPQISVGKFGNGLRYYVRVNRKPENRAELRLVVNAGSVLEEDDQRGLAHFVEHMAFNGTKHFAKQEIVKFMESIGMRFGPSLNAFTSFDETVYMLQIPTDRPEIMEKSFLILEDWAHNVTFEPAEIDKERGVIVEEWRLGRGAAARMQDQQFPVLFKGSRYAERLPIGRKEIIETFRQERLTKFYSDWYRPDLMAVIAVGDFDRVVVEGLIRQHFATLPAAPAPRIRPDYGVPDHPGTLYAIATDREATSTSVAVIHKFPRRDPSTVGAYREDLVDRLYTGMLNRRFSELAQKPDPPFMGAGSGRGQFVRTLEAASLSAVVKDGGVERGLDALFTESARVARFGFTATELERQKRDILRGFERMYVERDKQESAPLASEYVRNFTQGEPIPGIAYEYELAQRFLPEIRLEEVNALAKDWSADRSRVVLVGAPQKEGVAVPDAEKLAATMNAASEREVTPYVDTVGNQPLLAAVPAPGSIVKSGAGSPYGITEWELSNGVRVVLKPTDYRQDEVVFRAVSPGGTSLAADKDYIPASTASQVVAAGGVGAFSAIELRKVLSGKVASVRPFISDTDEGLSGSGSTKDLETMFQLIYLTFTQPRADATIFGVLTAQMKSMLANRRASPEVAFAETLQTTLAQDHYRARPMTPELVDEMNLQKSFEFYSDRFADAGDFTFFFVGSFDIESLRPLVERYLATLPSTGRKETWRNVGINPPQGVVRKTVRKGIEPKSRAAIVFTGPFQYDPPHRLEIRALGFVLETKLREVLREELGGTYSVSAAPGYSKVPDEEYAFSINFGCSPDRTEELVKTIFREIESLKADGPTVKEVENVKETLLRDLETNMKQNGYLLGQISLRYQYGEDLRTLYELPDRYREVTTQMIRDAARRYLNTGNYVQVALFPEEKPQP